MRYSLKIWLAMICAAAACGAGCAPARFVEGARFTAQQYGTGSADTLAVNRHGHLRFNHALQSDLDDAIAADDLATLQDRGIQVLSHAHELAVQAANSELDRLPAEGLAELVRRYGMDDAPTGADARRAFLKEKYAVRSRELLNTDLKRLEAAGGIDAARRLLRSIKRDIEPAAGDRGKTGRVILGAPLYLPAVIGAEIADTEATERAVLANFDEVIRYEPVDQSAPPTAAQLESANAEELARWFAPVFVQQFNPDAEYPQENDRFGRIELSGSRDAIKVNVDTSDPVVYWTTRQAKIGDRRYDQLDYVAWYPSRPAMSDNDPSAGHIDGVVIRITLDRHHRPAIYEYVRSCGCYHTLWVAEFVEAAARSEYGAPQGKERYAVQRPDGGRQLFLPSLVADDGAHPHRPSAFISAGYHLGMGIHPQREDEQHGDVRQTIEYTLEPYDSLTRLPLEGGVASMFGSDGLVHDAGRAEGWLLSPTGMLSAGQPRQLGTMKIRMDEYDYDDPRLLEHTLRLPSDF